MSILNLSILAFTIPLYHQNKRKTDSHGDNEYYDLKQVDNPWIQPNLIAWKIAAKGQGWYLKTMTALKKCIGFLD